jgi:hypothetical protein
MRLEMARFVREAGLSASGGDPEPLRDGIHRPVGKETHRWECGPGGRVEYLFRGKTPVREAVLVFDSGLDKLLTMSRLQPDNQLTAPPGALCRSFLLEADGPEGWTTLLADDDNHRRFVRVPVNAGIQRLRLTLRSPWEGGTIGLYGFYAS